MPSTRYGILILSFSFLLQFTAYLTIQNRLTTVFNDLNYNDLGSYIIGIIYVSFALSNMLAPKIIFKLRYRKTMILGSLGYLFLDLMCLFPGALSQFDLDSSSAFVFSDTFIYISNIIAGGVLGLSAAMIWVGQGAYITECSDDKTIGKNNGIFWGVFWTSAALGSLITGLTYTSPFYFFIIMSGISLIGTILFCFLPRSPKEKIQIGQNIEQIQVSPSQSQRQLDSQQPQSSTKVLSSNTNQIGQSKNMNTKYFCKIMFSKKMLRLWPSIFYLGFGICFYAIVLSHTTAQYAKDVGYSQAQANRLSSYVLLTLGVSMCISALTTGCIIDKCGYKLVFALQLIYGTIGIGIFIIAIQQTEEFSTLFYLASFLFGMGDSTGNTNIATILGSQFQDEKIVFGVFRLIHSMTVGIFSFITPFFLKSGLRQVFCGFLIGLLVIQGIIGLSTVYQSKSSSQDQKNLSCNSNNRCNNIKEQEERNQKINKKYQEQNNQVD